MSAATVAVPRGTPSRRGLTLAARILRMELRHSAFLWVIPLITVLFIYDPYRTSTSYPPLWPLRSTVVLNKFWPDMVVFAAGFAAWAGSREGRRGVDDLLGTTARPAWTRQLCSLAGTASWVVGTFLAGVLVLYVQTSSVATWGGPLAWPVIVGAVGMVMVCAVGFTAGALFPGRFTAPIVAVALTIITLVAFREAVNASGGPVGVLSPDGSVPGNDWGLFYPTTVGVPVVQAMFMGGVALAAVGLLGLSPRTGGVGWRGALSVVSAGGARLRVAAVSVFAVGAALAVAGFGLAGTATGSAPLGGVTVPAIDDLFSSKPIPYTPVCAVSHGRTGFSVCLHPAYSGYLSQVAAALNPVIAELSGLPGVPSSAKETSVTALAPGVLGGNGSGQITGGVYEFTLSNAVALQPHSSLLKDSLQQDLVHAVIVGAAGVAGKDGQFHPNPGTLAQQAVVDGLLKALGASPYPVPQSDGNSAAAQAAQVTQAQVTAAAARFAALPDATRRAWLAANLAALKAGPITLKQLP